MKTQTWPYPLVTVVVMSVPLAAPEPQPIVLGPLADLGPQPGDLVIAVIDRSTFWGCLAAGQDVIGPSRQGGGDTLLA
jgi:hypothetical protein